MSTRDKLVTEASRLLDAGGEAAVTLRAVGHAVGVSHNAPYRHFKDRSALLAGVAERDFTLLAEMFAQARAKGGAPLDRLRAGLHAFLDYGRRYPNRYRLLFSDPAIGAAEGSLETAALGAFSAFADLVKDGQDAGVLPVGPTAAIAGLIFATAHGGVDLATGGRLREEKGFADADQLMSLLLSLLKDGADRWRPRPGGGLRTLDRSERLAAQ